MYFCYQVLSEGCCEKEKKESQTIEVDEDGNEKEEAEEGKDVKTDPGYVLVTASSSDHMIKLWRVHTDRESEVYVYTTRYTIHIKHGY